MIWWLWLSWTEKVNLIVEQVINQKLEGKQVGEQTGSVEGHRVTAGNGLSIRN